MVLRVVSGNRKYGPELPYDSIVADYFLISIFVSTNIGTKISFD